MSRLSRPAVLLAGGCWLHLITCGGTFGPGAGTYLGNVVVFSTEVRRC